MDQDALRGWHRLEQLGERLRAAVAPAAGGVARAYELGRGGHRVLLMDFDDRLVLFVRPLFRERPRQTLEVRADGRVLIRARDHDQEISCNSRFAVTVLGDRIRFESANRREIANLWLPWVTPEDRRELARRIGLQVDRAGARRRRPLLLRPIFA